MAENVLETRIMLRYGTYTQWMNSATILRVGEAGVCAFPNSNTIEDSNDYPAHTPPAIGIKIGDGYHIFRELPWVQAVAADVYTWAKSSTKPTYTAEEIQGLENFIEEYLPSASGEITIAPRLYQIVRGTGDNINKYYLQYKENNENSQWILDTSHYIDVSKYERIANWVSEEDYNEYPDVHTKILELVYLLLEDIALVDNIQTHQFVTSVKQKHGKITVTRAQPTFDDIAGSLTVERGGTGASSFTDGQVLIGHGTNAVGTRGIADEVENNNLLVPNYLMKQYVESSVAGLTNAMHFIGEATVVINNNSIVNPNISGYDFSSAQPGDVILSEEKEFVWDGGQWLLLGDEGSYAVKGSIRDADIDPDANIAQSKIANLTEDLSSKVDKIEGKSLSTNDYTNEDKTKLEEIEEGAQVNAIEHIFVNELERPITTINGLDKSIALSIDVFDEEHATKLDGIQAGAQVNTIEHIFLNNSEIFPTVVNQLPKSVNLNLNIFTDAEKLKLANIEPEAQVNKVESLTINGTTYRPNAQNKAIEITLDEAALNLNILEGARYPIGQGLYTDIEITNKKLELARIAASGNIEHLLQTSDTYVTLDCGSSTEVI